MELLIPRVKRVDDWKYRENIDPNRMGVTGAIQKRTIRKIKVTAIQIVSVQQKAIQIFPVVQRATRPQQT